MAKKKFPVCKKITVKRRDDYGRKLPKIHKLSIKLSAAAARLKATRDAMHVDGLSVELLERLNTIGETISRLATQLDDMLQWKE